MESGAAAHGSIVVLPRSFLLRSVFQSGLEPGATASGSVFVLCARPLTSKCGFCFFNWLGEVDRIQKFVVVNHRLVEFAQPHAFHLDRCVGEIACEPCIVLYFMPTHPYCRSLNYGHQETQAGGLEVGE